MSHAPAAFEVLRAFSEVMEGWGGEWYVFGAQAVMAYGVPRLTADVDVTAKISPEDPRGFAEALRSAGFESRVSDPVEFARATHVLPVTHTASGLPVDVVLAGPGLEEEFLRRARRIDIGGLVVPVIAPEDLVVTKLLAGRPKDLDDARSVLREMESAVDLGQIRGALSAIETALSRRDLLPAFEALRDPRGR